MSHYLSRLAMRSGIPSNTRQATATVPGANSQHGNPVDLSTTQSSDIEIQDEVVYAPSSMADSTMSKSPSGYTASPEQNEASQHDKLVKESRAEDGDTVRPSTLSMQRSILSFDQTALSTDDRETDSFLTPTSNQASARPGEYHDVVAPDVPPAMSSQDERSFISLAHPEAPSTIKEPGELATQRQADPVPFADIGKINDFADKSGQTVSVFPADRTEYERSAFEPLEQFRYPSDQFELTAAGERPFAGISRDPGSEKTSHPNVQVRIGNIQVEVHQPSATPVEPVVPRPVAPSDSAPRPARLSRHYLRGW